MDLRRSAFFLDCDSIRREIDFLFSSSLSVEMSLLWEVLFAEVVLWATGQASGRHGLFLKNSECTLRSIVRRKQRIACLPDTHIVDDLLGFCCHLVRRVLDDLSETQNDGYHINWNTHWHVGLIPRRRVAAQLILRFLVVPFVLASHNNAVFRSMDDLLLVFQLVRIQSADVTRLSSLLSGRSACRGRA